MSTAQKTETKPDTRVRVAGHPLPWRCVHCEEEGDLLFIDDADGKAVFANLDHRYRDKEGEPLVPDSFYRGLVEFLNRYHGDDDWFVRAHEAVNAGYVSREEAAAMFGLEPGAYYELPPGTEIHGIPDPRVEALEAALVTAVSALEKTVAEGTFRDADEEDAILAELKETLTDLGLANRLPGNPAEAEVAVSS